MKLTFLFLLGTLALSAQTAPNTYVSAGETLNYSKPISPASYLAVGTLVTSSNSSFPTYIGFHYELYRGSAANPIAYAGFATIKTILYHGKSGLLQRVSLFGDGAIGGSGSTSSISSALQIGGGALVQLNKFTFPNLIQLVIEPQARRIPALTNGTSGGFLMGIVYSFNRSN